MQIYSIQAYQKLQPNFKSKNITKTPELAEEIADLRVFHHHIYEFKKGIRNLILTTEKSKYKSSISERLQKENIDYLIHDITPEKINVYFGAKDCVDVVKSFQNPKLNELTPEQDFMLGIMLGYDRVRQCERYMKIKNNEISLGKQSRKG